MFVKILIGFAAFLLVFIVVVALRPSDFRVTRSGSMTAPVSTVFTQVNELKKWEAWSPWAKLDPSMKMTYDGPPAGEGASYTWVGNQNVGEGKMTTVESRPNELIRFKLEFRKPFEGTNEAQFHFKQDGNQTNVTWEMTGKYNFIMKAAGLFMNCDKMIGGQFEQGLAQLKSVVESQPAP